MEATFMTNGDRRLPSNYRSRRKLSIPVALSPNSNLDQIALRRRFSNVGDAVTRKLSTTIGWRGMGSGKPPEEVIAIGRAMCTLYVRSRLKRAGVFNRKLGLTRVRSAVGTLTGCGPVVREVFPCLSCACNELERTFPRLYSNITRHTGPALGGGISGIVLAFGHHILRSQPTWGKIVAVYSVAGGLAVDCVRQGHQDDLHLLLEDMTELLEDKMAIWVHANGGWSGLTSMCLDQDQEISVVEYLAIFGLVGAILLVAYFVVRFFVSFSLL
ncbi:unnamed protein product [Brassicogethes aeneus]|uniref:Bcl-2 Bcl-2 homology region 1-3 domain-containing protein n=1 Tax=Brassicogethes aeneus TaxID=1431903 RepID=A0A9P0B6H0_BRAAE|nr:unnamed protein product [Brassicogethes aeneus]